MKTWYWEGAENVNYPDFGALIFESGSDELLAEVFMQNGGVNKTREVTSQIAAVPDLIASLKELVERRIKANGSIQCSDGRYERAVAALRKAGIEFGQ